MALGRSAMALAAVAAVAGLGGQSFSAGGQQEVRAQNSAVKSQQGQQRGGSINLIEQLGLASGMFNSGYRFNYIKRPFNTVAMDKRRARKARNIARNKRAMKGK